MVKYAIFPDILEKSLPPHSSYFGGSHPGLSSWVDEGSNRNLPCFAILCREEWHGGRDGMAIVQERQTGVMQFPGLSKDPEISFSSFKGYVGLGHFAIQQKVAEHCKST